MGIRHRDGIMRGDPRKNQAPCGRRGLAGACPIIAKRGMGILPMSYWFGFRMGKMPLPRSREHVCRFAVKGVAPVGQGRTPRRAGWSEQRLVDRVLPAPSAGPPPSAVHHARRPGPLSRRNQGPVAGSSPPKKPPEIRRENRCRTRKCGRPKNIFHPEIICHIFC